jgi:hypothetical protein
VIEGLVGSAYSAEDTQVGLIALAAIVLVAFLLLKACSTYGGSRMRRLPHPFSPIHFRATVVTDLLNQNIPLENVQYLAGAFQPKDHTDFTIADGA